MNNAAVINHSRAFEVTVPLPIKTYDIDFSGVVSNIVYVRWLEDMRLAMLAKYMPLESQLEQGRVPILAHTSIDYRSPLHIGDDPTGRMWVSEVWRSKWLVEAEISEGDAIVATARQTGYFVDIRNRRPVPVPQELAHLVQA